MGWLILLFSYKNTLLSSVKLKNPMLLLTNSNVSLYFLELLFFVFFKTFLSLFHQHFLYIFSLIVLLSLVNQWVKSKCDWIVMLKSLVFTICCFMLSDIYAQFPCHFVHFYTSNVCILYLHTNTKFIYSFSNFLITNKKEKYRKRW